MESKKWYQSKTVLINMIAGVALAIAPAMPGGQVVAEWLNGNVEMIGMVWAGLNVALRFITKDKVKLFD